MLWLNAEQEIFPDLHIRLLAQLMIDNGQGGKKVSGLPPILRFTICEETISYLFNHIFSPILNNPWKTAYPVMKEDLHFIESELIPGFVIASPVSSLELNSRSFKTPFNIQRAKSRRGLCLASRVGAVIVKYDDCRILIALFSFAIY
jgi:hypothetical protein